MYELSKMIHAGDVAVGERGFDGVLVPAPSLVLLQGSAIEKSFERRRAEFDGELAGVARDGIGSDHAGGIVGIAIAGGAESSGSGHPEPRTEVQRNGNARRQFVAIDEIGSLDSLIAAVYDVGKGVETKINGGAAPGGLLDGAEARFRQAAERNAGGGNYGDNTGGRCRCCGEREETLVVEAREVQAEATEIVREENGAAHFGVDGFAERVREGETKRKRR